MSVERIDHAAFGGGGLLLAALEAEVSAIELCSWFVHGSFMYVVHLLPALAFLWLLHRLGRASSKDYVNFSCTAST